jgi:hypothetical protein
MNKPYKCKDIKMAMSETLTLRQEIEKVDAAAETISRMMMVITKHLQLSMKISKLNIFLYESTY